MTFLLMIPVALFARVWFVESTANNRHHALLRWRSRQNPQPANRLGKIQRNPFIMAIAKKSSAPAKIGERHWGNSNWKRFIMAITLFSDGACAKPSDRVLGKFELEPVYHGDSPPKKRRSRQNRRPSTALGKFLAEPVYHGVHETSRIGEVIGIGEIIRIGEARRDGSGRRSDRRRQVPKPWFAVPRRSKR